MKVLTLKQPWATLIAEGYKHYEFRTWKTNYRGECLIHAGKGVDEEAMQHFASLGLTYPQSVIVAKVMIDDCIFLDSETSERIIEENPFVYGMHPDRSGYAFHLTQVEKITSMKVVRGKLGFWDYVEENSL